MRFPPFYWPSPVFFSTWSAKFVSYLNCDSYKRNEITSLLIALSLEWKAYVLDVAFGHRQTDRQQ